MCRTYIASYPGLLTPAFVACSTNAGEGLVKLSHVQWRTWTCGGVALSFSTAVKWLSEPKRCQEVILQFMLAIIVHSLTCGLFRNVPLLHMSRYVIARDSVYQAFPRVSTASDKTGVRRPGYKASLPLHTQHIQQQLIMLFTTYLSQGKTDVVECALHGNLLDKCRISLKSVLFTSLGVLHILTEAMSCSVTHANYPLSFNCTTHKCAQAG